MRGLYVSVRKKRYLNFSDDVREGRVHARG
jgi:hypothetical protein